MRKSEVRNRDINADEDAQSVPACVVCHSTVSRAKYDMELREIRRCLECGALFTYPLPTDDDLTQVYDEGYFRNTSLTSGDPRTTYGYHDYDVEKERNRHTNEGILDRLQQHRATPHLRLLDYGCGKGAFATAAHARGMQVEVADRNPTCLDALTDQLGMVAHPVRSLSELAPTHRRHYGAIALLDVFEHLANPVAELLQARELLDEDGILVLSTTDFGHPLVKLMGKRFEDFRRIQEHTCFLTRKQLLQTLQVNGYEILSTHNLTHCFRFSELLARSGMVPANGTLEGFFDQHPRLNPSIRLGLGIKYAAYARKVRPRRQPSALHATPVQGAYRVSVVMPVYNEEQYIETIVSRVIDTPLENGELELLIVDDGSTDTTRRLLERYADHPRITLIFKPRNQGKGSAVAKGISAASGDIVLIQDADLEYDPSDYQDLIKPILDGDADLVLGSRFLSPRRRVMGYWHTQGNRLLTFLVNLSTNLNLSDMETCYKAMTRTAAQTFKLRSRRFNIEPEIICKAARHRLRIYEVPINYNARSYAEGKKIGFRDVLEAVITIIRYGVLRLD